MIMVVAAVYDSKVGAYLPPFFVVNQAVAQRAFADIANHPDHQISRNPTDYALFIIGNYNDETAEIRMFPQQINLGLAASYIRGVHTGLADINEKEFGNVPEKSEQAVSDAARVLTGAEGGNSKKHVRSFTRAQNDLRRGVSDPDPS